MPLNLENFVNAANSAWFGSSDVVIGKNAGGDTVKVGNLIFSSGKKVNDETMDAFRKALSQKYGVFGEHAFDYVLGERSQLHKSLRACDVKKVLSKLEFCKKSHYINELGRQLDTNPKMMELPKNIAEQVRDEIMKSLKVEINMAGCETYADLVHKAEKYINEVMNNILASSQNDIFQNEKSPTDDVLRKNISPRDDVEMEVKGNEPTGLRNLKTIFKKGRTSVEDRIKGGYLGVGMRINRSSTNSTLLVGLKKNGVEPGFIYKNDWSASDTKGLMDDYNSDESIRALEELKEKCHDLAKKCQNLPLREQIMLCGRAHPAALSAVAEYMLENGMKNKDSTIFKAFCTKFPLVPPDQWEIVDISTLKKELFVEIRDAVLNVRKGDPDYDKSPIFKHFADRHIVKLDYNEGDRIFTKKAASAGKFMRPERIIASRGKVIGQIYRLQTAKTADSSSVGAVTEALANDLTRICGIPSQELTIVRGEYSDGHPKLMLEAKFATGYSDFENGYITDGQIVPPNGEKVESLGKYKAFFLVTADRDAVGSRGQNKGFVKSQDGKESTFFAIDPGHSLEGNGRYLEVDDNFSFKDTYGVSTKPRFKNFSVFDDDTRFSKFKGALDLRTLKKSGMVEKVFTEYRTSFDPNEVGISDAERSLRLKIKTEIDKKEAEFNDSLAKVINLAGNQFNLYDDLAGEGEQIQEMAIETIENLEKLTSPTTWVSPDGKVPLKHLSVIPETRIPWRAHVDGDNIIYHCDEPLSADAKEKLKILANSAGVDVKIDAEGCAKLTIAKSTAGNAFKVFSERNVANLTHTDEAAARATGGTGLDEARAFAIKANATHPVASPAPPFDLPDTIEIKVGKITIPFVKKQYEAMLANTPDTERPKSLEEFKSILASRILRGRTIIKDVMQGKGHRHLASVRNAACVTLALHAATAKKGEYNERGAFSVEDPDGRLYQWLDSCKEVYLRTSTHASAYHHMTVDNHMNMPRGLDIPEGMGGLMGGMRTFHYFALPNAGMMPRRLYLKCETYGIYRSTISADEEEKSRSLGMQTRQKRTGDTRESIKHCMSLFTVFTRMGDNPGNRKENAPAQIKSALETAQNRLKSEGFPEISEALGKNVAGRANGGMRMLLSNLMKLLEANSNNAVLLEVSRDLIDAMSSYAEERTGWVAERMGNEVMLDLEEIF